jgi:hypothetical protein
MWALGVGARAACWCWTPRRNPYQVHRPEVLLTAASGAQAVWRGPPSPSIYSQVSGRPVTTPDVAAVASGPVKAAIFSSAGDFVVIVAE